MRMLLTLLLAFAPMQASAQSQDDKGQAYCTYAFLGNMGFFAEKCRPKETRLTKVLMDINQNLEPKLLDAGLISTDDMLQGKADALAADCKSSDYQYFLDQLVPQIANLEQSLNSIARDARTPIRTECVP